MSKTQKVTERIKDENSVTFTVYDFESREVETISKATGLVVHKQSLEYKNINQSLEKIGVDFDLNRDGLLETLTNIIIWLKTFRTRKNLLKEQKSLEVLLSDAPTAAKIKSLSTLHREFPRSIRGGFGNYALVVPTLPELKPHNRKALDPKDFKDPKFNSAVGPIGPVGPKVSKSATSSEPSPMTPYRDVIIWLFGNITNTMYDERRYVRDSISESQLLNLCLALEKRYDILLPDILTSTHTTMGQLINQLSAEVHTEVGKAIVRKSKKSKKRDVYSSIIHDNLDTIRANIRSYAISVVQHLNGNHYDGSKRVKDLLDITQFNSFISTIETRFNCNLSDSVGSNHYISMDSLINRIAKEIKEDLDIKKRLKSQNSKKDTYLDELLDYLDDSK